jgi:hypothetical protein
MKEFLRHGLVNEGNLRRGLGIAAVKPAARQDGCAQRLEITGRDKVKIGERLISVGASGEST